MDWPSFACGAAVFAIIGSLVGWIWWHYAADPNDKSRDAREFAIRRMKASRR